MKPWITELLSVFALILSTLLCGIAIEKYANSDIPKWAMIVILGVIISGSALFFAWILSKAGGKL